MKLDIGELGDPVDALATFSPAPLMECAGRLYPGVDPASLDFEAAADAVARTAGLALDAWAARGDAILGLRGGAAFLRDGGEERWTGPDSALEALVGPVAFAPGFAFAAAVADDPADPDLGATRLVAFEPRAGRTTPVAGSSGFESRRLAWTRVGIAALAEDGALEIVDAAGRAHGAAALPWGEEDASFPALAVSADGARLALVRAPDDAPAEIWVAEAAPDGFAWRTAPALRAESVGAIAWRPGGDALLAVLRDGAHNLMALVTPDGGLAAKVALPSIWAGELAAWSGDGARAWAADGPVLAVWGS
jgi:hypothetical protein